MNQTTTWRFRDEVKFLVRLGTYSQRKNTSVARRRELLKKYLDSFPKRKHWGDITPIQQQKIFTLATLMKRSAERRTK